MSSCIDGCNIGRENLNYCCYVDLSSYYYYYCIDFDGIGFDYYYGCNY